ncbi:MAG: alpha/beta fold hydrolase [Deltaproteobacteria bacterium]|nr:alpha/beta fold hydrolase [Deltaproteobacteria bacterium]
MMLNTTPEKKDIQSKDGVSSQIRVFRSHDSDAAVIICMPAMGVAAKHYSPLAKTLAVLGWNVITADLRGNGDSLIKAGRGTDFGYHEMVVYDWPSIVNTASDLFPHSNKFFLGHSLGGQLSALYMSRWPGKISALILVAAPLVYYRGWPFHYGLSLLLLTQIARMVSGVIGYFPAQRFGFGRRVSKKVSKDWAYTVRTGRYDPKGTDVNYEELLPRITAPVLAVSFSDDRYAPEMAVNNFCSKMSAADTTRWHLAPEEIGHKEMGHMGVLKPCDQFLMMLSDWLSEKT